MVKHVKSASSRRATFYTLGVDSVQGEMQRWIAEIADVRVATRSTRDRGSPQHDRCAYSRSQFELSSQSIAKLSTTASSHSELMNRLLPDEVDRRESRQLVQRLRRADPMR